VAVHDVGFVPEVTATPPEVDGKLPKRFDAWATDPAAQSLVLLPPPLMAWPLAQVAVTVVAEALTETIVTVAVPAAPVAPVGPATP
jgi:hypothetical protein